MSDVPRTQSGAKQSDLARRAQERATLSAELTRFAALDRVVVALDFDGTLAPEVDEPDNARALPAAVEAIVRLAALADTHLAFVSGRSLSSLDHVTQSMVDAAMIGSHGLELRWQEGVEVPVLDDAHRVRVRALHETLIPLVDAVDGAWIESKPAGCAVHTRVVDHKSAAALQQCVQEAAGLLDRGLTVREGKNVLEFSVCDVTKGDGLLALRQHVNPNAVFFAGDDVTDEDALAALVSGDVGVKVGDAPSVAAHRVPDPAAMADVLLELADLRESHGSGR